MRGILGHLVRVVEAVSVAAGGRRRGRRGHGGRDQRLGEHPGGGGRDGGGRRVHGGRQQVLQEQANQILESSLKKSC